MTLQIMKSARRAFRRALEAPRGLHRPLRHPLVEDRTDPLQRNLARGLQNVCQRLGQAHQSLDDMEGRDQVLVEQLQMAYRLTAVAGLDGEPVRAGLLVQAERRVPARAGENARRQQSEPPLLEDRRRPVPRSGDSPRRNRPNRLAGISRTRQGPAMSASPAAGGSSRSPMRWRKEGENALREDEKV